MYIFIFLIIVLLLLASVETLDCNVREYDPRKPDPAYVNTPLLTGVYMGSKPIKCDPHFIKLPASQVGVNPFIPMGGSM